MKKILAFSDFHDKRTWYRRATSLIQKFKPDIVILAGDQSNYGSTNKINKLVTALDHQEIYYVWGNMDGKAPGEQIDSAINLHLNIITLNDLILIGLGGDEQTFEKNLPEFEKLIEDALQEENKQIILVTHIPPHEHGDLIKTYRGNPQRNVGSKKYLELIKKIQPSLVICGHIHEARGIYKIGKTIVCNVGKECMEIALEKAIKITDLIDEE